MSKAEQVSGDFLPRVFSVSLGAIELIDALMPELSEKARQEPENCWVHLRNTSSEHADMRYCEAFASLYDKLTVRGWDFGYSFLKVQLQTIEPLYGLHVDSNAGTGVGVVDGRARSWRILANLGDKARCTTYSLQSPLTAGLEDRGGLSVATDVDKKLLRTMCLPAREGATVFCGILCVSEVMHQADDNAPDIFASFGYEEDLRDV